METNLYFSNIRAYRRIVKDTYKLYLNTIEAFDKFKASTTINYNNPDYLENIALESVYTNQLYDYSITCLIFEALSVESLCNHLITTNLSNTYIEGLDRLDVINKFLVAIKMITQVDFPKDKKSYALLGKLIRARNKLVHSKTIKMSYESIKYEELTIKLENQYLHTIDKVLLNELITTYDSLIKDIPEISHELAAQYLDT